MPHGLRDPRRDRQHWHGEAETRHLPTVRSPLNNVEILDRVLDKGIVIDAWVRVSLAGAIDLFTIETRVVVASIETYLKYSHEFGGARPLARSLEPDAAPAPRRPDNHS